MKAKRPFQRAIESDPVLGVAPDAPPITPMVGHIVYRAAPAVGVLTMRAGDDRLLCAPLVLLTSSTWIAPYGVLVTDWTVRTLRQDVFEGYLFDGSLLDDYCKSRGLEFFDAIPGRLKELVADHARRSIELVEPYNEAVRRAVRLADERHAWLAALLSSTLAMMDAMELRASPEGTVSFRGAPSADALLEAVADFFGEVR